ncbi:hypothetical protein F4805DRAFT_461539 [Annulohypoxylon moriforme]|nr:hypothetical protein F4805DRAFT_461539 [Annulohypoxylon moriforme]
MEDIRRIGTSFLCDKLAQAGSLPTVSARWFRWRIDEKIWGFFLGRGENPLPFPYQASEPEKFGKPWCETYLTHLQTRGGVAGASGSGSSGFVATGSSVKEMELKQLAPFSLRSDEDVEIPDGQKRHPELLASLWEKMFPALPHQYGCDRPFSFRLLTNDGVFSWRGCLGGSGEEMEDTARRAAAMLGGRDFVLIVVLAESSQIFLDLEFAPCAEMDCPAVQSRFLRAWQDLQEVNLGWLKMREVHLLSALGAIYERRITGAPNPLEAQTLNARAARGVMLERKLRMGDQYGVVRRAALREAAEMKVDAADGAEQDRLDRGMRAVSGFVRDGRFGCLAKEELLEMVKDTAVELAGIRVRQLVGGELGSEQLERGLASFVSEPQWNDVATSDVRLDVCVGEIGRLPNPSRSLYEWAAKTRLRLAVDEDGGDAISGLEEEIAKMTI